MKKFNLVKVLSLILVVAALGCVMCGCGRAKMNVKVGIKLGQDYIDYMYEKNADNEEFIIPNEDRNLLNDIDVEIVYKDGEQVSALTAFIEATYLQAIEYTLDSAEQSVKSVKTYGEFSGSAADGTNLFFFWTYTINGVEPTTGRAATNYVKDGDVIVFTLTSASENDFKEEDMK